MSSQHPSQIDDLIRALADAQAALQAALPDQVDAVINPSTATPILLHRAQEMLQVSEARYRHLLSRVAAIVFELAADGTTLFVNDSVREATGYEAQELLGKNWWNMFCPGEQRRQIDVLVEQIQRADVSNWDLELTTKGGTLLSLELNTANHYGPDGQLERILGLAIDVTERKRAERRRQLLNDASAMLNSSLDYQTMATKLAQLAVPIIGDWCAVHLVDVNGTLQQIAVAHADPDKAARVAQLYREYAPGPNPSSTVWRVLQSGKAELHAEITDAMLAAGARNAGHLEFMRTAGIASLMVVPLAARGRVLGAIQFVLSGAGRRFDLSDLAFAEELASRAAIAIDNARLYQEAREGRERLRITLSSIGDAVIATDPAGCVSFMNTVAESLTGWTQAEAEGVALHQIFQIVDETNREPIENPVVKVMRERRVVGLSNHTVLVARNGTEFYIDDNAAPIWDDGEAIVGIILVFRDITERRREQLALRNSEQRFKAIFDQAGVGITAQAASDFFYQLVNPRFCQMLGYSQDELLNFRFQDITYPDDLPSQLEQIRRVAADEIQSYTIEKRFVRKDGLLLWANVISSLVSLPANNAGYFITIVEDITDRKRADEQVRFQAHLLDTVEQAVIATNLQGQIIYWNHFAETLYGWSAGEVLGRDVGQLIVTKATAEQAAEIMAHLNDGKSWSGEFDVQRRDGTVFPAMVNDTPIYDTRGALIGIVGISKDITERRKAQEALRQSGELSHAILSSLTAHIAVLDKQGRIIAVNEAWETFARENSNPDPSLVSLGVNYLEVCRQTTGPDAETAHVTLLGIQSILAGTSQKFRLEYLCDTPIEQRWFAMTVTPLALYGGAVVSHSDITERKRAALAEHEQRILAEALRDTASALVSSLDLDTVMNRVLQNLGRVISHQAAMIMLVEGGEVRIVYSQGYSDQLEDLFRTFKLSLNTPNLREMFTTGLPVIIQDTATYSGWATLPEMTWVRASVGTPIKIHGNVIGFIAVDSNHTHAFTKVHAERLLSFADQAAIAIENAQLYQELHRHVALLEQRVRERTNDLEFAKQRVEAILSNSGEAIVVATVEGTIDGQNPAFLSLFGYQTDETTGKPFTVLSAPEQEAALSQALQAVIHETRSIQLELVARRQDGSLFDAEVTLAPIMGSDQKVTAIVSNVRDVTPHKQIERELNELNRLKTEFLSTAAHELRTPLTSIRGFSELLLTRQLDEQQQKRYLNIINEQSTQLGQLIDDLLDISRMEAKRGLSLHLETVDLGALINQNVTIFAEAAPDHEIRIEGGQDSSPMLVGDPFRLTQVIRNLLSNAIKYSPNGGKVSVRLILLPDAVRVSVQDEGIGMTPEQLSHMFEKFYRADYSNTAIQGTGLGLTICKLIVELHGGNIWVESERCKGSTFFFTLPIGP